MILADPRTSILESWRSPSKFFLFGEEWNETMDLLAVALYLFCGKASNLFRVGFPATEGLNAKPGKNQSCTNGVQLSSETG